MNRVERKFMIIKNLPESERPYEKAQMYGIESLSNAELLAIIIKTGTKEKTSVQLAQELLAINTENKENIQFLNDLTINELTQIKGIGTIKAIQIQALCEINKRMSKPIDKLNISVRSSKDLANLFMQELSNCKREKVKVIMLNTKCILLRVMEVATGGTNNVSIAPKDILAEAIKIGAPKIAVVHNHPSGNPEPSTEDIKFTETLDKASKILGIELLDHVVVAGYKFFSVMTLIRER